MSLIDKINYNKIFQACGCVILETTALNYITYISISVFYDYFRMFIDDKS